MAESLELPKATCPARSNSLPSTFHPLIVSVEDHLYRLKASEAKSSSICGNLSSLKDFLEHINDLVQLPRTQEPLSRERCDRWIEEVLDGSLVMLDACGTARDVLLLMKESVQELQSSLRRKRGTEFGLANEVSAYMISRKKINKMVSKRIENLKKFEKTRSLGHMDKDSKLVAIVRMFREVETISFSVLRSVLSYVSKTKAVSKQSSWSLVSKFMQPKRVLSDAEEINGALCALNIHKFSKDLKVLGVQNVLKQLETSELVIQELEEGLESLFRCLIKTRVSLLNVLNQ